MKYYTYESESISETTVDKLPLCELQDIVAGRITIIPDSNEGATIDNFIEQCRIELLVRALV